MKAFLHKNTKNYLIANIVIASILSSCSWVKNRRTLFGGEANAKSKKAPTPPKSVTPEQYEELAKKYEIAQNELRYLKAKTSGSVAESTPPEEITSALSNAKKTPELVETVDVFEKKGEVVATPRINVESSGSKISSEVLKLQNTLKLYNNGKLDQAMMQAKELEFSNVDQVRVRAKFIIGEILFTQKEYDLAMQIYEGIISKEAFSGVVLKTLGRLIVCSEKLKIVKKQEQYYSILHDFFES